ncbi:hypothetical protein Ddc_12801 [Ditylenchus destructor]|nr:hypothetical protein Ddc_12801 [Ditylenchus destructor]
MDKKKPKIMIAVNRRFLGRIPQCSYDTALVLRQSDPIEGRTKDIPTNHSIDKKPNIISVISVRRHFLGAVAFSLVTHTLVPGRNDLCVWGGSPYFT